MQYIFNGLAITDSSFFFMRKIELLESEMDGSPATGYVRYDDGFVKTHVRTFIPNP